MGKKAILHCKTVLDLLDITVKSDTHRKCRFCGKEFLVSFSHNTIYKHCIKHGQLRKIIKSNIPASCYNEYIKLAGLHDEIINETLTEGFNNDITVTFEEKNEDEMSETITTIEEIDIFCKNQQNSEFSNTSINRNEHNAQSKQSQERYFFNREKTLSKGVSSTENFIGNSPSNTTHDNNIQEDDFVNPLLTPDTMSNCSNLDYSNCSYCSDRLSKFFKQTNELGLTLPISKTQNKCASCDFIYPSNVYLIDIYTHAAGHDDLLSIMKVKLHFCLLRRISKRIEKLNASMGYKAKSNSKTTPFKLKNNQIYIPTKTPPLHSTHYKNKPVSNQPSLAVIGKLRQRPFETDVIKLTHIENDYRICNKCGQSFTLNDRPYDIYKHCFHHKEFHEILIDNLEHNVLLGMLKKAKREQNVKNNKK